MMTHPPLVGEHTQVLEDLVSKEKPDLLCLQETKLQKQNAAAYGEVLKYGLAVVG